MQVDVTPLLSLRWVGHAAPGLLSCASVAQSGLASVTTPTLTVHKDTLALVLRHTPHAAKRAADAVAAALFKRDLNAHLVYYPRPATTAKVDHDGARLQKQRRPGHSISTGHAPRLAFDRARSDVVGCHAPLRPVSVQLPCCAKTEHHPHWAHHPPPDALTGL